VEAEPRPDLGELPAVCLQAVEHATALQLQVLRNLIDAIDRAGGYTRLPEYRQPMRTRLCKQKSLYMRHDFGTPGTTVGVGGETRVGTVFGLAHRIPKSSPDIIVAEAK